MLKLYFTYIEHLDNIRIYTQMYEIINMFWGNTF